MRRAEQVALRVLQFEGWSKPLLLLKGASDRRTFRSELTSQTVLTIDANLGFPANAQVWPVHKLVCGERAHPFVLSPFEQSEADRIVKVFATRAGDEVEASLQSLARMALDAEDTTISQKKVRSALGESPAFGNFPLARRGLT